jgi:hypothetical protein
VLSVIALRGCNYVVLHSMTDLIGSITRNSTTALTRAGTLSRLITSCGGIVSDTTPKTYTHQCQRCLASGSEHHSRMLGNGYCSRPADLDCHYETICESCTFFVTTIEFRPTLQAQRDDAARKGQTGRQKVYDGLLQRLDQTGT